jgi:hypothetical protein
MVNMENSTLTAPMWHNSTHYYEVVTTTVICDSFNIGILIFGLRQMYFGIEVGHPVFATLFCNLVSVLAVSIIETLLIPFLNGIRVETLVKSSSAFYALFHASTWLIMSILRYIYIVHNQWVHKTFPEARTLAVISITTIYCIFGISMSIVIPVFKMNGWPYIEVSEMDREPKIACLIALLGCYGVILTFSNIVYVLILHQRGAIGKNGVGVLPEDTGVQEPTLVS